jgi:hypothetical protein
MKHGKYKWLPTMNISSTHVGIGQGVQRGCGGRDSGERKLVRSIPA